MKRIVSFTLACMFAIVHIACAEGLLPTLTDVYGIPMPSLGGVLPRYADSVTEAEDGSSVETWNNVSEEDFESFSSYLEEAGAALQDYAVKGGVFEATIAKNGRTFYFSYDPGTQTAIVSYPEGTYDERAFEAEAHYNAAKGYMEAGQYEEAIAAFEELGNYSDAAEQITETQYMQGKELLAARDYAGAFTVFNRIKGYKDVDSLLSKDDNLVAAAVAAARDAAFSVGQTVTFGTYLQTSAGNAKTPIEWLVLARDGQKALLVSKYGLDAKPYNTEYTDITWEECTLRTWLNETFLNTAFSAEEQEGILLTNVDNGNDQGYSKWKTSGGNNTQDRIFLLSCAEANQYLGVTHDDSKNTQSRVSPTEYADAQGAYTSSNNKTSDGNAAGWWWLRSPGNRQCSAARVYSDGSLYYDNVIHAYGSVRPALWVNLESGIF